ncbi:MAG: TonB-dependent receptor [Rhodospirillaceae bacterium]|nr:TonB-dependent receptor [Rhodospirillaceae bacterium]
MTSAAPKTLRLALLLSAALFVTPAMAQETAGQLNGFITNADGAPLGNAQVRIVHTPTGAVQNVTTNAEGRFIGRGLRLGGPYEVTVTAPGGSAEQVKENVFLTLGQPYVLDYRIGGSGPIEELVVVAARRLTEQAAGPTREFDSDRISSAPTLSRDLKDVIRGDSKVFIDRSNSDAIQIAGTSNRFNLLTIDGVRQNDDFGLNNGGYPSLRPPLSVDFIEQLSVNSAPYGVTYSGFQGGNINVVTKSGTNDWSGSAYYYYTDDSLIGDKSKSTPVTGLSFKDKYYGGTLGGPIIEDKLFFFAGYERFTTSTPVTRGPTGGGFTNEARGVTQADYNQIKSIAQSVYGYDILDLPTGLPEKDEKIFGKLNWNISDFHRAVVSYNRSSGSVGITNSPAVISGATSIGTLSAGSNWYQNKFSVDAVSAQVFSDWTDEFKTEFKVGYKLQKASPTPLGAIPFSEMQIQTPGGGLLVVGPDEFRHFNVLDNKLWQLKAKGDYLLGDHTITAGYEREMLDIFNAFLPTSYGQYFFASIADFQARRASIFRYTNAVTNVQADGAANLDSDIDSFYIQDAWNVLPDLTLTAGLRYETYSSTARPRLNTNFQTRYGFANTFTYDGRDLWLPRFSFNYTPFDTTVIRGGVGLFGGGNPNVWLANSFSNDGVGVSNTTINRSSAAALVSAVLDNVVGNAIPAAAQAQLRSGDGSVNAIDPNFKIPSVWKYSVGFDQQLDLGQFGRDWLVTGDLIYSNTKNGVLWVENRVIQSGTLPDGRPRYIRRPGVPASGNDLILTNTKGGETWVASLNIANTWDTSVGTFDFEIGYTFTDSKDVNPATSSTAQSNWDNLATSDINNPTIATSNYELKRNIVTAAKWTKAFWGEYETSVSLFGQNRSGRGYSYTFAGASPVFGDPRQSSRQRQLFYVPRDANDVILAGGLTFAQLDAYIVANGLDKYRGQIVPRNAFTSPSVTQVDFRFEQEIPGIFEDNKGVFVFDIRNLTNLIDSGWGQERVPRFPYVVPVVQATGIDAATGKYIYSGAIQNRDSFFDVLARQSVWQIQFGVRYEF